MRLLRHAALLALCLLCAAKDDGFDSPVSSEDDAILPLADWARFGPEWADKVHAQAFLYGEAWSQQDVGVIDNNKMINTNQPASVPRFTNVGFKKTKMPKKLFKKLQT